MRHSTLTSVDGLLGLMHLPGVGPAKAIAYARGERSEGDLDQAMVESAITSAQAEIKLSDEQGVSTMGFFDQGFPPALKTIPSPPAIIYCRGNPSAWATPSLAVVGTRDPTPEGARATAALTTAAAQAGFSIVSGLAFGIDKVAHEAALREQGSRTVAVLGSGLDLITPNQHSALAETILASGGALVSEQPLGTEPSARTLVARNRLQAGLAQAVLVGQTGLEGGTMHTVRFAAAQGKPVYCPVLSSDPVAEQSAGLEALLVTPARELPTVLPAWRQAKVLADHLGASPLGIPVEVTKTQAWLDALKERVTAADQPPHHPPKPEEGQLKLDGV
jgi:DNA processing protein